MTLCKKNAKRLFSEISAVIFDMDGVIVDTMPFHAAAWQGTFRKFGVHVTKREIYLREGEKWDKTFFEILKREGKKVTSATRRRVLEHREKVFKKGLKVELFKYAPALINRLKKKGLKLGLVTGTPRREVKKLLPARMYRRFDVVVTGDQVRRGKPHPEPFLKALKALKTAASDAIVIENAPHGIKAAKRAKLRVIAIETSLPKRYLKEADLVLKSLNELKGSKR
jgi:beta-phosphoglucomutase